MALEVREGDKITRFCTGISFGAHKSIAGELVFQTGMVGYPESITDPSYRGQILVITFPLVGNYGVPSRETRDPMLPDLPAYFESADIHIAGLIVASYSGEDYSHYLAKSSLGTWLKEQGVPAVYGVDTRALTKRIRDKGSMLGRLLKQTGSSKVAIPNSISTPSAAVTPSVSGLPPNGVHVNGTNLSLTNTGYFGKTEDVPLFEEIAWSDPNTRNLVADGEHPVSSSHSVSISDQLTSLDHKAKNLLSSAASCVEASVR